MLEEDFGTTYDALDVDVWNEGDEVLTDLQRHRENTALKRTQLVAMQLKYSALARNSRGPDRAKYDAVLDMIQEELDELDSAEEA